MSVEAMGHTLYAPVGGNLKVILLGLANHARPDGTGAYPCMETLAKYTNTDRRACQRNMRKLEAEGYIEREGKGPKGQHSWRICLEHWPGKGDTASPQTGSGSPTASVVQEPQADAVQEPPEPSSNRPNTPTPDARTRGSDQPPPDFPDELRPHARRVYHVLQTVAEQHEAKAITPLALGHVLMAHPHKHHVTEAHKMASHFAGPSARRIKDVVATYRRWLDHADDMATAERMPEGGDRPVVVEGYRERRARAVRAELTALQGGAA